MKRGESTKNEEKGYQDPKLEMADTLIVKK